MIMVAATLVAVGGALTLSACVATGQSATGARLDAMKASPNWRDGEFVNSLPAEEPSFFGALGKWLRGADNTTPDSSPPVVRRLARDFDVAPASGLRITWRVPHVFGARTVEPGIEINNLFNAEYDTWGALFFGTPTWIPAATRNYLVSLKVSM